MRKEFLRSSPVTLGFLHRCSSSTKRAAALFPGDARLCSGCSSNAMRAAAHFPGGAGLCSTALQIRRELLRSFAMTLGCATLLFKCEESCRALPRWRRALEHCSLSLSLSVSITPFPPISVQCAACFEDGALIQRALAPTGLRAPCGEHVPGCVDVIPPCLHQPTAGQDDARGACNEPLVVVRVGYEPLGHGIVPEEAQIPTRLRRRRRATMRGTGRVVGCNLRRRAGSSLLRVQSLRVGYDGFALKRCAAEAMVEVFEEEDQALPSHPVRPETPLWRHGVPTRGPDAAGTAAPKAGAIRWHGALREEDRKVTAIRDASFLQRKLGPCGGFGLS